MRDLTGSLQSTLFQNPGGFPERDGEWGPEEQEDGTSPS